MAALEREHQRLIRVQAIGCMQEAHMRRSACGSLCQPLWHICYYVRDGLEQLRRR